MSPKPPPSLMIQKEQGSSGNTKNPMAHGTPSSNGRTDLAGASSQQKTLLTRHLRSSWLCGIWGRYCPPSFVPLPLITFTLDPQQVA